jgi:hypothetical protein
MNKKSSSNNADYAVCNLLDLIEKLTIKSANHEYMMLSDNSKIGYTEEFVDKMEKRLANDN